MKRRLSDFSGLTILENLVFNDERGDLKKIQLPMDNFFDSAICSNNTSSGTVRGLHFQNQPYGETKVVSCLRGEMIDFIVDMRANSETFGDWTEVRLSSSLPHSLLIPEGFAHGYQTLEDSTTVLYLISGLYNADNALVMDIQDQDLGIVLPMEITEISPRDIEGESFRDLQEKINFKK